MKEFVFVAVILQVIILCRGKPTTNEVATTEQNNSDMNDTLYGLVSYARPIIAAYITFTTVPAKTSQDYSKDSFSSEVTKRAAIYFTIRGIQAMLPFGSFIVCMYKLWTMRSTPRGIAVRKYLKNAHRIDLDPLLALIDGEIAKFDDKGDKSNAVEGSKNTKAESSEDKDVKEVGEYIYGVLEKAYTNALAWEEWMNSSCANAIKTATGYYNSVVSKMPEVSVDNVKAGATYAVSAASNALGGAFSYLRGTASASTDKSIEPASVPVSVSA